MDEVVDDLRAVDGARYIVRGGRVGLDPADVRLSGRAVRETATTSCSA